jgi:hypothetical protein
MDGISYPQTSPTRAYVQERADLIKVIALVQCQDDDNQSAAATEDGDEDDQSGNAEGPCGDEGIDRATGQEDPQGAKNARACAEPTPAAWFSKSVAGFGHRMSIPT